MEFLKNNLDIYWLLTMCKGLTYKIIYAFNLCLEEL